MPGIDPQSGFRLPMPSRESLDDDARALYDGMTDPKGGTIVGLRGPGGIRLLSPKVAVMSQPLNRYLRFQSQLGARVREIAILTTAREYDSQFEWAAHEPEALKEGVPQALIEVIKHNRGTDGLAPPDALVIEFGRELLRTHKLSQAMFDRALAKFGALLLVDLISLIANYAGTAMLLAAFDMQLRPGDKPLLPPR
jgi:4-carboxymuconolactone decarboxylase